MAPTELRRKNVSVIAACKFFLLSNSGAINDLFYLNLFYRSIQRNIRTDTIGDYAGDVKQPTTGCIIKLETVADTFGLSGTNRWT